MHESKVDRIAIANQVLAIIAKHGGQLFYSKENNRTARFELSKRTKQIWFIDAFDEARVYVCSKHRWLGFSESVALRPLIEALRDFIRIGTPLDPAFFGSSEQNPLGYAPLARDAVLREILAIQGIVFSESAETPQEAKHTLLME